MKRPFRARRARATPCPMNPLRSLAALVALSALAACSTVPERPAPLSPAQEAFWQALSSHCGMAYRGALASEDPRDADWQGRAMIAHWAQCSPDRVAIAFHVAKAGAPGSFDRSRTWIVTRTGDGLTLKHDHRHEDGTPDAITFYGGNTHPVAPVFAGTARAQDFLIDNETVRLFLRPENRERLNASLTNVWRMEVDPAGTPDGEFAYQLTRIADPTRLFRAEFHFSDPVPAPPPAWGW